MESTFLGIGITLLILLIVMNGVLLWFILRSKSTDKEDEGKAGLDLVLQQLNELNKTVDSKMLETHKSVEGQFRHSQDLIRDINKQVNEQLNTVAKGQVEMKERSNQIFTIAEQLQDLQRTLKSQKERGNFGEASLELILSNILPPDVYQLEYRFSDNDRVDAVIHARDGMIPVDAKFSLESYTQFVNEEDEERRAEAEKRFMDDLKKRINETAKYIKPKEGTLPFAFMFIPAEGIYYDLLVGSRGSSVNARNLIDYAMNDKKVIIVSPTTFYAYLQSVLYGFNAFKIEKNTEQIQKNVGELSRHLKRYDEFFKKLGASLKTTVNHYNSADKELSKIDKDVVRVTGSSTGIESGSVEPPHLDTERE